MRATKSYFPITHYFLRFCHLILFTGMPGIFQEIWNTKNVKGLNGVISLQRGSKFLRWQAIRIRADHLYPTGENSESEFQTEDLLYLQGGPFELSSENSTVFSRVSPLWPALTPNFWLLVLREQKLCLNFWSPGFLLNFSFCPTHLSI